MCFHITAIICPIPPSASQASITGSTHVYKSLIYYQCADDYRFFDGSTHKTIICEEPGIWNDSISNCEGLWQYMLEYSDLNIHFNLS